MPDLSNRLFPDGIESFRDTSVLDTYIPKHMHVGILNDHKFWGARASAFVTWVYSNPYSLMWKLRPSISVKHMEFEFTCRVCFTPEQCTVLPVSGVSGCFTISQSVNNFRTSYAPVQDFCSRQVGWIFCSWVFECGTGHWPWSMHLSQLTPPCCSSLLGKLGCLWRAGRYRSRPVYAQRFGLSSVESIAQH